jgi:hypothetical protein
MPIRIDSPTNLDGAGCYDRDTFPAIGLNPLTGEADGTNLGRLLCDVNEEGKRLVEEWFGGTVEVRPNSNWNNKVDGQDSVGSVMLTRSALNELLRFAYVRAGCVVYEIGVEHAGKQYRHVYAVKDTPGDIADFWDNAPADWRTADKRTLCTNGTAGTRNRHEISGRTA